MHCSAIQQVIALSFGASTQIEIMISTHPWPMPSYYSLMTNPLQLIPGIGMGYLCRGKSAGPFGLRRHETVDYAINQHDEI